MFAQISTPTTALHILMSAQSLEEIQETFEFLDDWETRYKFILDLGKALPDFDDADRVESNLVRGCQSQVWLVVSYEKETDSFGMAIDSDAHIVRGLIAIVLAAFDDKTPLEITDYPIEELFNELNLLQHLSPTRGNGLRALVGRIRLEAAKYLD